MDSLEEELALVASLDQFLADNLKGVPCHVEDYAKLYPRYAQRIQEELSNLEQALPGGLEPTQPAAFGPPSGAESLPTVAGFRIAAPLGRGASGRVYRALQEGTGRTVALKVYEGPGDTAVLLERFEREARLLAKIQHPAIPDVWSSGRTPTVHGIRPFLAVAWVDGQTLRTWYAAGCPLPAHLRQCAREQVLILLTMGARLAAALASAHAAGILHRDIKPANVLLDASLAAYLIDFGVGRDITEELRWTADGCTPGTPAYMPPEQRNGAVVDERSDQWSLGAVLFEGLLGRPPRGVELLEADAVENCLRRALSPKRTGALGPGVAAVLAKALAPLPGDRYASVAHLAADLECLLDGRATSVRPASFLQQLRRSLARRLSLLAAISVCGLLIALMLWRKRQHFDADDRFEAAYRRVLAAHHKGDPPSPADLANVSALLGDGPEADHARELLVADPFAAEFERMFGERKRLLFRGQGSNGWSCSIDPSVINNSAMPALVVERELPRDGKLHALELDLTLYTSESKLYSVEFDMPQGATHARIELPHELQLPPDRCLHWTLADAWALGGAPLSRGEFITTKAKKP